MKTERELFEARAKKETNWDLYLSENIKQYMDHQTNGAWYAWQARVPEGYVVVPVEPSDYMKCTVRDFGPDIEDYENMSKWDWEKLCAEIYKAMIEAVEK